MNRPSGPFLSFAIPFIVASIPASTTFGQGQLAPAGPPAPTMKTLEEIEARIPISALPATLVSPGSYYVVSNLTGVASSNGITIAVNDVTLDLNGFALIGVPGSLDGVHVPASPARTNLVVRNGTVRDWGGNGVFGISGNSRLTDLTASDNGGIGLAGISLDRCSASDNGNHGILGVLVTGCFTANNGGRGIDGDTIISCHALNNTNDGIKASTVTSSEAHSNGQSGIEVDANGTVTGSSASNNDKGIVTGSACTVTGSTATRNATIGIEVSAGSTVRACTASENTGDGIVASDDCIVAANTCGSNGFGGGDGAGIHITGFRSRIEANHCAGAPRGLEIDLAGNYIEANTVVGNTDNYDIAAGNQLNLLLGEIPETIDWPAVVTLAGTLTGAAGSAGITVDASDVRIDLKGHALVGVPGSLHGITMAPFNHDNIMIQNGTIRSWGQDGVFVVSAAHCQLIDLRAITNGWEGVGRAGFRVGGGTSLIRGCLAQANQSHGIRADDGAFVTGCVVRDNGGTGLSAGTGSTVTECTAKQNGGTGITIGSSSLMRDCTSTYNTQDGFRANSQSRVSECNASYNDEYGFDIEHDCTVSQCSASRNDDDGIHATSECNLSNNTCTDNGLGGDGSGIHVTNEDNHIEENVVIDNDLGIEVSGPNNLIIRNTARGNDTNYVIVATNKVGVIVSAPSSAAVSGSSGGAGVGTTDPWANLSY